MSDSERRWTRNAVARRVLSAGLACGLVVIAASASAQEPAKAPEARSARIAVINMGLISSESLLGKSYAAKIQALEDEINAERNKKQAELQKLDEQLKTLQEELEKQANVLSPEALDKKRQEIVRKQRERQAFLEDGQAEIQRLQQRAQQQAQNLNNEFQLKIRPYVEAAAKEKGVDILLDSQVALAVSDSFDISRDIIVKADDAERAGGGAAAPAPSPSPQQ
jgi:Skp family chaperone for outer membrane proteins